MIRARQASPRWAALASVLLQRYVGPGRARSLLSGIAQPPRTAGRRRQLLVDVSTIVRRDAGTGIQRVVRAVLRELLREPPPACDIRPVYARRWRGYRYADGYAAALTGRPAAHAGGRIDVAPGDAFLALDLTSHLLPRHRLQLARWKAQGVAIQFVVHDLLPATHPQWFTRRAARNYRRWIACVASLADKAICTSRTGAALLQEWLAQNVGPLEPPLSIGWFHLGSDIQASAPSAGIPGEFEQRVERLRGATSILMVGTIEPRKAHREALAALEALWARGEAINLVLVGAPGWKSADTVAALRAHPERGRRLHWFEAASDEALSRLYETCQGVLMPSFAEGFGLPVVEAARFGKPLLVRDIPIFREIAGANAAYFPERATREELAAAIAAWAAQLAAGTAVPSAALGPLDWRESTRQLVAQLSG